MFDYRRNFSDLYVVLRLGYLLNQNPNVSRYFISSFYYIGSGLDQYWGFVVYYYVFGL